MQGCGREEQVVEHEALPCVEEKVGASEGLTLKTLLLPSRFHSVIGVAAAKQTERELQR